MPPTDQPDDVNLEIERSYLLNHLPNFPADARELEIEQGYLPKSDKKADEQILEGRLRRTQFPDETITYTNTIKRGEGLVRTEIEHEISEDVFNRNWPRTEGRRLRKTRVLVREGEFMWEIDQFHDLDMILAEVELKTVDQVAPIPEWLSPCIVREVTDEPAYRNYRIAIQLHQK